ncbi:hypothetical protein F4802DRAFT_26144 [Xylaria palmicola]|nr:hypothetical protein F4802DRAFT_26144 [Xylaria palmicola]
MRLARQVLRHVQLTRPVPPRAVPWAALLLSCCSPAPAGRSIRFSSASASLGYVADSDLIYPAPLPSPRAPATSSVAPQQTAGASLVQETKAFHRWSALLADPVRLAVETDFFRGGPAKEWRGRLLVDKFENHGDLSLWSCLLDYQMRINGPAGVAHVWKALWGRKALHEVGSPLAEMFWRVMLEGALLSGDKSFLEDIWVYSEWMYDLHRVRWPHLYTTVMKHMLRTHQHQQALQWQLRLAPNFYPGPDQFAQMIKEFALDKELYRLDTLPSLYKINPDKHLYNVLLPYLFDRGESRLARTWRRIFIRHGDVPLAAAPVRSLLRFLRGYYPHDPLVPEELTALRFTPEAEGGEKPDLSREFMNRVHGQTFGITVKNYNDRLGAKWFASTWVSLDVAISTISALGIQQIGPLSLQSIALRTENTGNLLSRISQLRAHGISIADSNYSQLILQLARRNDADILQDLLQSDLHPDVFDDLNLQTRLIDSTADILDWKTLRLLLIARLSVFERSARGLANSVLRIRFQNRDQEGVLQVLGDMKARNIPLNLEEGSYIYESLIEDYHYGQKGLTSQLAAFYLAIFRQLKSMDVPVPLTHWKLLMLSMTRRGRLEDLERLSVELVDMFLGSPSLRPGFVPVHICDIPETMKDPLGSVENLLGVYIPQDTPAKHERHPLRVLFGHKVITELIEHAFITQPGQGFRTKHDTQSLRHQSQVSQLTKTVRLLCILRERGMWLRSRTVQQIVLNCLVNIYGPGPSADAPQRLMRASNTLSLREMKSLIDESWGDELLPPLDRLTTIVHKQIPRATLVYRAPAEQTEEAEARNRVAWNEWER